MAQEERKQLRIVFMGTPGFAATILDGLANWQGGEIVGVYTQPDRPRGRGRKLTPSDVKKLAQARRFEVYQTENFQDPQDVAFLKELRPDVICVAAYGLILPVSVLQIPAHGCINVHASLLPKYRGAAPIQRAIQMGDPSTGITIMRMDKGLDTGDMMLQRALAIGIDDTAATLHDELADLGARMLVEALELVVAGTAHYIPQNDDLATYAPKLAKQEGIIDWNRPALEIHNHIRAMHPWPGAGCCVTLPGSDSPFSLSIFPGTIGPALEKEETAGAILGLDEQGLKIATQDRIYFLHTICPDCKKPIDAASFYNGYLHTCDLESVCLE